MNITILDDYQDTIRTLACFPKVAGHTVTIWNDHTKDVDTLAGRLKDTEALVLIRERTPIRAPLLERLDKLRLISQAGVVPHIDVEVCTRRGVVVCSHTGPGRPSYATAELTWGLVIAAISWGMRRNAAMMSPQVSSAVAYDGRPGSVLDDTITPRRVQASTSMWG